MLDLLNETLAAEHRPDIDGFVGDSHYDCEPMVAGMDEQDPVLVNKLYRDATLWVPWTKPPTGRPGRPRKYAGRFDRTRIGELPVVELPDEGKQLHRAVDLQALQKTAQGGLRRWPSPPSCSPPIWRWHRNGFTASTPIVSKSSSTSAMPSKRPGAGRHHFHINAVLAALDRFSMANVKARELPGTGRGRDRSGKLAAGFCKPQGFQTSKLRLLYRSIRSGKRKRPRRCSVVQESTLMAYLVPRLTNRREDTATDALAFILNKSSGCRDALVLLLRDSSFQLESLTHFETQATYEDRSRPDMAGYDQEGRKRLLVESKFWASLLQGQASGFFSQLEGEGRGLLLFIAPGSRLETLWAEIRRQMETGEDGVQLESVETAEQIRKARIASSDKRMMLVSWTLLLDRLAAAVPSDSVVASDIQQLRGLCRREDDEAFQPINAEELGPSLARRVQWLNRPVHEFPAVGHQRRYPVVALDFQKCSS